jgi:hypothetical protein
MRTWTWASAYAPALGRMCALFAMAALAGGCTASVEATPPPPPPLGTAIVDWTINGSNDPAECTATGAATFNVSLYNSVGGLEGQWVQACSAFATTINGIVPDTYTGSANLLDAAGSPRTTTVSLAPFAVVAGLTATVPIDFPVSSFF